VYHPAQFRELDSQWNQTPHKHYPPHPVCGADQAGMVVVSFPGRTHDGSGLDEASMAAASLPGHKERGQHFSPSSFTA